MSGQPYTVRLTALEARVLRVVTRTVANDPDTKEGYAFNGHELAALDRAAKKLSAQTERTS